MATAQTQQFIATGTYSAGASQPLTNLVTWTSSDPTVASISATGLVTPLKSGTVTIGASLGTVNSTNTVTVTVVGSPNTLTLSVPQSLPLGTFTQGQWSKSDWGATGNHGTVTETAGTDGSSTSWTVTAAGVGYMTSTSPAIAQMVDPLIISPTNDASWSCADGSSSGTIAADGTPFSGKYTVNSPATFAPTTNFDLWAAQYVRTTDVAGNYGDTITFTVGFTP